METEKCENCGVEVEKGTLIRDSIDTSQLRCNKCITPDKKVRKARKKKAAPEPAPSVALVAKAAKFLENPPQPIDLAALRQEAEKWAQECSLKNAVADEATREDYPHYGFGYVFHLRETGGKQRMGTARYTCHGERSFWTLDGMITG